MRIALDTNVLISAYTTWGLSADVYRYILADHELILSDVVLTEFKRLLETKFGVPERYVDDFLHELRSHHVQPSPPDIAGFEFVRDLDDRVVLASAIEAGAEVLVTGDRDLLDVRDQISIIEIQTPREFWQAARRGSDPEQSM